MKTIVVFGSALSSASPRDIDVAHSADVSPEELTSAVRAWAAERGVSSTLPIDAHLVRPVRTAREGLGTRWTIILPVPRGGPERAAIVVGDVGIEWIRHDDLPARVRLAGASSAWLREALESGGRLAIRSPVGGRDWDGYTQGLVALRNAIAHAPAWADAGRVARSLDMLLGASESALTPLVEWARPGSPGGTHEVIVRVDRTGVLQIHAHSGVASASLTWDQVAEMVS